MLDKTTNIASIFKFIGQLPLCLPVMQICLKLIKYCGISFSDTNLTCMRLHKTVQKDVIYLPREMDKQPRRSQTVDLKNCLFSREPLRYIYPWVILLVVQEEYISTLLNISHNLLYENWGYLDRCCWNMKEFRFQLIR